MVPQSLPCAAQVVGLHEHWCVELLQVLAPPHDGQFSVPLQPSGPDPQAHPLPAHVCGVQTH
jgi:hypothetical protein